MSILLLGARGYIAHALREEAARRKLDVKAVSRSELDYTRFAELRAYLLIHRPVLCINAAAFVTTPSVDLCEERKGETLLGNLVLPATVANACDSTGTHLLHISTGCLYNGVRDGMGFTEEDPPQLTLHTDTAGIYVGSKQLAEEVVGKYGCAWICRIRLPFDEHDHHRNYISKLMRYPKVYENLNSLAHRGDFAKACLDLWQRRCPFGTYNMTNPGAIRASEIVALIKKHLQPDREFQYWDDQEFMATVAKTPKSNCYLNTDKLAAAGVWMRPVQEAVEHAITHWEWEDV